MQISYMKLYLEKSKCKINESLNGRVWEIETDESIYIESGDDKLILHPENSEYYSIDSKPFLTNAPKTFSL